MLLPLKQAPRFDRVSLVATDVDGTLTQAGRFRPELLAALSALRQSGIAVLLVTGRAAGWVDALRHYLPVSGAIAENGGVFLPGDSQAIEPIVPIPEPDRHRQQLAAQFDRLRDTFPPLQAATDNSFRLTDWTFAVGDLSPGELAEIAARCQDGGWGFTYSTVQCHIQLPGQNKAAAISQVLARAFPHLDRQGVLTVGDSPNDASMFDGERFPLSVGVANITRYRDRLAHLPAYVTAAAESAGFCELVRHLVPDATGL